MEESIHGKQAKRKEASRKAKKERDEFRQNIKTNETHVKLDNEKKLRRFFDLNSKASVCFKINLSDF